MTYSLHELARASGVGRAAIRHYVKQGLLPAADRHGSNPRYDERHLHVLLAIRRLRSERVRARALAERIRGAGPEEIRALAGVEPIFVATAEPEPPASLDVAPVGPPPRSDASIREAVDALVCTLAEALDVSPRGLRAPLGAMFARMRDAAINAEQAASAITARS